MREPDDYHVYEDGSEGWQYLNDVRPVMVLSDGSFFMGARELDLEQVEEFIIDLQAGLDKARQCSE